MIQYHVHDLADEIWFRIYSYLEEEVPWRSMSLGGLFREMQVISKDDLSRLMRYARQVPRSFLYERADLIQFAWACRNQIKIEKLDFRNCDGVAEHYLCLHMLKACNLSDLRTFKDRTFWFMEMNQNEDDRLIQQAVALGLPREEIKAHIVDPSIITCVDIQKETTRLLLLHAPKLQKICIETKKHELYLPLITEFSDRLVDLTLKLFEGGTETRSGMLDNDLEQISHFLEPMPRLKKLKINACFPASFRVRSKSLTKLDVRGCLEGFWIQQCYCPKLKIFRMSYHIHKKDWTGAIPIAKVKTQTEIEDTYRKLKSSLQDYTAEEVPCSGLVVPGTCKMRLFIFNSMEPTKLYISRQNSLYG